MESALHQAEISPEEVAVVFASANSTGALDRVEALAIEQMFGPRRVPVVSIKGAVGEFGASGAAAVTAALLCLNRDVLPPTAGFEQPDPGCPVDVSGCCRRAAGRVALVNGTADGGAQDRLVVRARDRRG